MIFPSIAFVLAIASSVSSAPHNKHNKRQTTVVAADALILNTAVAYEICIISRQTFLAAIAIGDNVTIPSCAAYDLVNGVTTTSTRASSTSFVSSTTTIPAFTPAIFTPSATPTMNSMSRSSAMSSLPSSIRSSSYSRSQSSTVSSSSASATATIAKRFY